MVEVYHLADDILGGPHADTPQKRTHSSPAKPAAERAAQLGDHGERPRSVDTVLIGRDIDQVTCWKRQLFQGGIAQKVLRLWVVAIHDARRGILQSFKDRDFP